MRSVMKDLNYATVVLQPLDAACFRARDCEGRTHTITNDHDAGELVLASKREVENELEMCKSLLKLTEERLLSVVMSLLRYMGMPSCNEPGQLTNSNDMDFYSNMKDWLETMRTVVQDYLVGPGHTHARIVDPNISVKGHRIFLPLR